MNPHSRVRWGVPDGPAPGFGEVTMRGVIMVLVRHLLGGVLRRQRMRQGRTLRQVSADARVSLGYISEVERGQKEASSELLAAICTALDVPLSTVLHEVSEELATAEKGLAPDVVGPEFEREFTAPAGEKQLVPAGEKQLVPAGDEQLVPAGDQELAVAGPSEVGQEAPTAPAKRLETRRLDTERLTPENHTDVVAAA